MSATKKETFADCPVCADKFTKEVRKPVTCPYCDFAACNVCCKKYLTDGVLDAHCMSCRRAWNDEFLDLNFTRAFRIGPYKKHRENVLLEREMAILPTRQNRVEARVKMKEVEEEIKDVNKELAELEVARTKILRKSHLCHARLVRFGAEYEGRAPPAWTLAGDPTAAGAAGAAAAQQERAKFIMKCPDSECRGFLSTAYKCGTCQMWACPDCLVIKGKEKDAEHTCDPGQKESVALILKESKPCPKCGNRISKVDGCDQMWCTDCHTAFSWTTGQIVNGVIHNPHYYEFLRKQGNGVAPRNAGDVPCGGVPYYGHINRAIRSLSLPLQNTVMAIHRVTAEINDYRITVYQGHFNVNDNGDLGVRYLVKEISKDQMKSELAKRELKRNKHLAIRAILEMLVTTSTMMLNAIVNDPPKSDADFQMTITEFTNLRKYVNESLMQVSRMKNCSVPQLTENWQYSPYNKAVKVKKEVSEKTKKAKKKKEAAVAAAAVTSQANADPAEAEVVEIEDSSDDESGI
jgi:hypothetical protein